MRSLSDRRSFLRQAAFAALAAAGLSARRSGAADLAVRGAEAGAVRGPTAAERRLLVVWLNGGPSQLDTWDPKPGRDTGGPFAAIPTAIPGVSFAEPFPLIAKRMDKLSVVRTVFSREGNHPRARVLLHTGYPPAGTGNQPAIGALVASRAHAQDLDIPLFVSIGGPAAPAGFLGAAWNPFVVDDPTKPVDNLALPGNCDEPRFRRRLSLLDRLNRSFSEVRGEKVTEAHRAYYRKAISMMRSERSKAFDLALEPAAGAAPYGAAPIGRALLMARRLFEAGVRVVEVAQSGWDTHKENFATVRRLGSELDPALSASIDDLSARGLLASTVVIVVGEFGRTPSINANAGRDHFPAAFSVLIGGGGLKGGVAVGTTSADGRAIAERPVSVPDLFATMAAPLGLDPAETLVSPKGRPTKIVNDGTALRELVG